jgi:hypothetical protein
MTTPMFITFVREKVGMLLTNDDIALLTEIGSNGVVSLQDVVEAIDFRMREVLPHLYVSYHDFLYA